MLGRSHNIGNGKEPMKKRALLILLISIFLFPSCGAKYGKKHEQRSKRDQGYVLFEKAEIEFNARAYVTARRLYQEYLRVSPSGQMVPASLFKIGVILSQKGEVVEARDYFNRIIQEFPDSFFYGDAKVEYLFTYYKEGRYQEVIDHALVNERLQIAESINNNQATLEQALFNATAFNMLNTRYFIINANAEPCMWKCLVR